MSDDGAVIALPFYSSGDKVALTRDGGATWQVLGGTQELWQSASVSPDGSRVVASYYAYGGRVCPGTQWSDDYGQTFRLCRSTGSGFAVCPRDGLCGVHERWATGHHP